jgi:hypothetical protein
VVGVEWPEGDERATRDLADQWYGVAAALAGPYADAATAANEVRGAYGGLGAEAFEDARRRLADGDDAPLPVLLAVANDLVGWSRSAAATSKGPSSRSGSNSASSWS